MTGSDVIVRTMNDTTHVSTVPPATTDPAPSDPRPLFARAAHLAHDVASGVRADQLSAPTPCDAFDVRTLIEHLVEVAQRVAALGEGRDPMALPGVPAGTELPGLVRHLHDDIARAVRAFEDDATLDRTYRLPWGAAAGREQLATYTNELTVHTWDVAVATGQQPAWDDDVVALADEAIHASFPPERAPIFAAVFADMPPEMAAGGYPWRDAVSIDAGAPIDRLVAYNGRMPGWQPVSAG